MIALAACGRDDRATDRDRDRSAPTATDAAAARPVSEWRAEVETACDGWNQDYAHLAGAEPLTADEALEHARDVRSLAKGIDSVLSGAGLPDQGRDSARRLAELTGELADAASDLAGAATAKDGPAIDVATKRIESLGERINPIAEDLGVPACGGY